MPWPRSLRFSVSVALVAVVALAACDSATPSAATPSSIPSASAAAGRCEGDDLAASGIEGRVVDRDGNPLNDILIIIETAGFYGDTRTGEDGVFSAPEVSGEFVIGTVDADYAEVVRSVTVPCGETVEVELVLSPVGG